MKKTKASIDLDHSQQLEFDPKSEEANKTASTNEIETPAPWQTGYGRGRPQTDEVRPPSKNAQDAKKYRTDNTKWQEYNKIKQAEWVAKNPERRREISRAYYARKKARQNKDDE